MLTNGVLAIVFANSLAALPMLAWQKLLLDSWQMQLRDLQRPQPTAEPDKPFPPSRSEGSILAPGRKVIREQRLRRGEKPP
jgi:hypothetical protein